MWRRTTRACMRIGDPWGLRQPRIWRHSGTDPSIRKSRRTTRACRRSGDPWGLPQPRICRHSGTDPSLHTSRRTTRACIRNSDLWDRQHHRDMITNSFILTRIFLTRFNKIAIQGAPQMAVDKEAISLSRVYSYYSKCNLPFFYV